MALIAVPNRKAVDKSVDRHHPMRRRETPIGASAAALRQEGSEAACLAGTTSLALLAPSRSGAAGRPAAARFDRGIADAADQSGRNLHRIVTDMDDGSHRCQDKSRSWDHMT